MAKTCNGNEADNEKKLGVRRVQLDLPPRAFRRLLDLKAETEASTYAEVIRNALKFYAVAIEEYEAGNELMLKQRDGTVVPYLAFKL